MAYRAKCRSGAVYRVALTERPEGVYIWVWETSSSKRPERDYLQDTLQVAFECCVEDYQIMPEDWQQVSEAEALGDW